MRTTLFILALLCSLLSFAQKKDSTDLQYQVNSRKDTAAAKVFKMVEQMPEFPGGEGALLGWFMRNFEYPEMNDSADFVGSLTIRFVVNEDGSVSDICIRKGFGIVKYDKELISLFEKLPRFKPGMQAGVPVKVSYIIPIKFGMDDGGSYPKHINVK